MQTLEQILSKIWIKRNGEVDADMIKYCLKSTTYLDMGNYYLDLFHKPSIDKTLYSSDEDANGNYRTAPEKTWAMFRAYNIRSNSPQCELDRIQGKDYTPAQEIIITEAYQGRAQGLKQWTTRSNWDITDADQVATPQERQIIIDGLKVELKKYEKRLATYWKRYSQCVWTQTYWANR